MFAQFRQRLQSWVRPRAPEVLPVLLDRHRIYVLPTRTGMFFAFLLGAMLLGALNFNNNPAILLALLLSGAALASLIAAHLQLSGLRILAIAAEPVPAGTDLRLKIALEAADTRIRNGLQLAYQQRHTHTSIQPSGSTCELHIPTLHRGVLPLPRLQLSTVQPLGLARAWAYIWPQQTLLVYPAPEVQAPPLPVPAGGEGQPQLHRAGDSLHHLRDYRHGDSPRTVAWKASARHNSLLVRDYEQQQRGELLLDWQHTAGLPYEQRISRLARWVDDAERQGRRYALQLPAQPRTATDAGDVHRHQCLRALALLPRNEQHGD